MGTYKIENHIGTCPVCGESSNHLCDEKNGREVQETYICEDCNIMVTYVWQQPEPTRQDLYEKYPDGVTNKKLDRAEQEERWARDQGKMIIEQR